MFSPPESCLCHFSTWSKKVVIQLCFPLPKNKETHARPITHQPPKPIKSTPTAAEPNNHQPPQSPTPHLTHQPPKPNTLPSTTADAKARDEQPPLLHASCRRCRPPVFAPPPGVGLQCRPRTLIAETASVSSLISFEFC